MNINKPVSLLIVVLIIIIAGSLFYFKNDLIKDKPLPATPNLSASIPTLKAPELNITPAKQSSVAKQAWTTWENYIKFAKAHNLAGVRSLAYQMSDTCNDPTKEKECFELMDSVVGFSTFFNKELFTHSAYDDKQIVLWTDGPNIATLYFTRDENGNPKVLALRICQEGPSAKKCIETDPALRDTNNNGWWDTVETSFH